MNTVDHALDQITLDFTAWLTEITAKLNHIMNWSSAFTIETTSSIDLGTRFVGVSFRPK
jgi:uncharacterized membrane protein YcfT